MKGTGEGSGSVLLWSNSGFMPETLYVTLFLRPTVYFECVFLSVCRINLIELFQLVKQLKLLKFLKLIWLNLIAQIYLNDIIMFKSTTCITSTQS